MPRVNVLERAVHTRGRRLSRGVVIPDEVDSLALRVARCESYDADTDEIVKPLRQEKFRGEALGEIGLEVSHDNGRTWEACASFRPSYNKDDDVIRFGATGEAVTHSTLMTHLPEPEGRGQRRIRVVSDLDEDVETEIELDTDMRLPARREFVRTNSVGFGGHNTTSATAASSITSASLTPSGTSLVGVAKLYVNDSTVADRDVSSCTIDGTGATNFAGANVTNGDSELYAYYVTGISTSSQTASYSMGGSCTTLLMHYEYYSDVDQTTPFDGAQTDTQTYYPATVSATVSSATDSMVTDMYGTHFDSDAAPSAAATANTIARTFAGTSNLVTGYEAGAASVGVGYTAANFPVAVYAAWNIVEDTGAAGHFGIGAAAAQAAAAAGVGTRSDVGSGAVSAQAASAAGVGFTATYGVGAAQAQNASAAGVGVISFFGSGSPVAQDAAAAGTGVHGVFRYGSGTLQAQDAAAAGDGVISFFGSGAVAAQPASAAGAGVISFFGDGSPAAQNASVAGVGTHGTTGSGEGALQAQDAGVAGVGTVDNGEIEQGGGSGGFREMPYSPGRRRAQPDEVVVESADDAEELALFAVSVIEQLED